MCDYSLCGIPNRLAMVGERLLVHRFPTNTVGLASPVELRAAAQRFATPPSGFWKKLKSWFTSDGFAQARAVCVPPGATLVLRDIPFNLQRELGAKDEEEVTFVQMSAEAYTHRDAVRFENGKMILLQRLEEGQRVDLLCVALREEAPVPLELSAGNSLLPRASR